MKSSRKAKRYDDSVLPGDFHGYDQFEREDLAGNGLLFGEIRRNGRSVDVGQLALVTNSPRKQSFAKLRSKAETLSREATYLGERLEIVDHDRRGMYIQLRSLPPYKDDTQIQFNEICIGRDKVSVKRIEAFRQAVFLQIRTDLEGYKALPPDVLGRSLDFLVAKKESKELVPGASPEDLAFLNQLRTIEGDKAVSAELRTKAARVREAFTLKQ